MSLERGSQRLLGRGLARLGWCSFLVLGAAGCVGGAGSGAGKSGVSVSEPARSAGGIVDLEGRPTHPLKDVRASVIVLVFISNDCPIANRYAPELARLRVQFAPLGVRFVWVHPLADETPEAIREHAREYGFEGDIVRDPQHVLVQRSKVRVTPEAAVFTPAGQLVYHGRIDDRNVELGVKRPVATVHDLEDSLIAVLAGKPPVVRETRAVGCRIPERR